jgi:hypothetical protein
MQIIIDDYERGLDYTSYDNLREQMNVSRIMLDILLEEATSEGLIQKKIIYGLFEETTTTLLLAPKGNYHRM